MRIFCIFFVLFVVCTSQQVNITIDGFFSNCQKVLHGNYSGELCRYNGSKVQWGIPTIQSFLSGLEFVGMSSILEVNGNQEASIGHLIHHNWPINGNIPNYVDFDLHLTIMGAGPPQYTSIPYTLEIDETSNKVTEFEDVCPYANDSDWFGLFNNQSLCCPYYTPEKPCSDRVRFVTPFNRNATFYVNETEYTLRVEGFVNMPILNKSIVDTFITQEGLDTSGVVFATLGALCSKNATCDDHNECTLDQCVDGFCDYNITSLNHKNCTYAADVNHIFLERQKCFEDYCWYGECIRKYYNCSESSSEEDESSPSEGGDDDDGTDLIPLYASLASLACLCTFLLLPLLCLPLCCLPALLLSKSVSLPTTAAVSHTPDIQSPSMNNPLYTSLEQAGYNPFFEV